MTSPVVALASELIALPSLTPDDAGCQALISRRLAALGFACESMIHEDVSNLWATRVNGESNPAGSNAPLLCFAGHTDVVPTGPLELWSSAPFEPVIRDNALYGRGAADMKGSLAAMICATAKFIDACPNHRGALAFLITSDEEGPAINGTRKVIETLQSRDLHIDHCLVGEPSSSSLLGDVARVGRRGSLNARLCVHGVQGHVAFPEKARNPIHAASPALSELCAEVWDQGNEHFPATSFQISNIRAGTGAENVIPGDLEILFNFRYSTALTEGQLKERTEHILAKHGLAYKIDWRLSGAPFLSKPAELINATVEAVREVTGRTVELSTGGGTSDGRFIAPTGTEVIELGPLNASIHKIDEHVDVDDLETLEQIYFKVLVKMLS